MDFCISLYVGKIRYGYQGFPDSGTDPFMSLLRGGLYIKDSMSRKTPNRSSPVRSTDELKAGDHICFLYNTEQEHRLLLTQYIRKGLEDKEKVIYVTDNHTPEAVIGYLQGDGMEVEPYLRERQLVFLPVADVYIEEGVFHPDGIIDFLRAETQRALEQGFSALRVTGEMGWVLHGLPGSERLVEYEAKLNTFFPQGRCLALCQYDKRKFSPDILQSVFFAHPIVAIGTEFLENLYYIPPENLLGVDLEQSKLDSYLKNLARYSKVQEKLSKNLDENRNNVEKWRRILECIADGVVVADLQGTITDLNEKRHPSEASSHI
jgi:PAS domain-containing protein